MSEMLFHGAVVVMSIVVLFVLYFTAWQSFVVDVVRQRAFEARDSAFLWAYDNGRLDSAEYSDFRETINVAIRYYEEMSLLKIISMLALRRKCDDLHLKKLDRCSFFHDSHLSREFNKLTTSLTMGLFLRSPIGIIATMLLVPAFMLSIIMNGGTKARTEQFASRIKNEVQTDLLLAA